jgi:hypothetical protein
MPVQEKLGSGTFCRTVGITSAKMRELEAAGIIAPTKSDSGWRQFTHADIAAAIAWKQNHLRKAEGATE